MFTGSRNSDMDIVAELGHFSTFMGIEIGKIEWLQKA